MKLCDVGERTRPALSPGSCRTTVFTGEAENGANTSVEGRATAAEVVSDSRKLSVKQLKVMRSPCKHTYFLIDRSQKRISSSIIEILGRFSIRVQVKCPCAPVCGACGSCTCTLIQHLPKPRLSFYFLSPLPFDPHRDISLFSCPFPVHPIRTPELDRFHFRLQREARSPLCSPAHAEPDPGDTRRRLSGAQVSRWRDTANVGGLWCVGLEPCWYGRVCIFKLNYISLTELLNRGATPNISLHYTCVCFIYIVR